MKKLLPLMIAAWGCGNPTASEESIVGGKRVTKGSPVAQGAVALSTAHGYVFCSGVLVAPKVILTAAHCLEEVPDGEVHAVFARNAEKDPTVIKVDSYFQHPLYHEKAMLDPAHLMAPADLGILYLPDPAPADYKPLPLIPADMELTKGTRLTLAGYGVTTAKGKKAGILREVQVRLKNIWHDAKEIEVQGAKGKGACMGDSGGPAILAKKKARYLVGLTSRGSTQCDKSATYTSVQAYGEWIQEHISKGDTSA